MTPHDFIAKWGAPGGVVGPAYALNEEQGAQSHFLDLCELLDVPKPGSAEGYRFEEKSALIGGKTGYADVFKRGVFAWENKAPGKNLDAALKQLLTYSLALSNPPLLVVSDRLTIRLHTQFTGHPSQTHTVTIGELDQPNKLALLRRIWIEPESFKPKETNRDITEAAARSFATLAEGLRRRSTGPQTASTTATSPARDAAASADSSTREAEATANQVAHFLTQCVFCFFAEDVGLLPGRMFERLLNNRHITPAKLSQGLSSLFGAMADGGMFGADDIVWFNGGLFKRIDVPALTILDVTELRNAAALNWSAIDVSIFGTLFERGLDPAKRSQLGAHYTDPATIDRLIDPVLRQPLLQKWKLVTQQLRGLQAKNTKKDDKHYRAAQALFIGWLDALKNFRLLDPACGSGNFLFLGLKALKDIEHQSHLEAAALGLDREADLVTGPHNVLGIELNEYAAELARVTVWIGELQWRMAHGYAFKINPVLEPLAHIECRDALLAWPDLPANWHDLPANRYDLPANRYDLPASPSPVRPEPVEGSKGNEGFDKLSPNGYRVQSVPLGANHNPVRPEPVPLESNHNPVRPELVEGPKGNEGFDKLSPNGYRVQSVPLESNHDIAQQNACAAPVGGAVCEAAWPQADIVIGNPPFLGGSKKRRELGAAYFEALDSVFAGRVPGGADLVCYWFEKARSAIAANGLTAAGLVATNSIRGGANRKVLERIIGDTLIQVDDGSLDRAGSGGGHTGEAALKTTIFAAWADEPWVNDGAAVRVSLVCFGHSDSDSARLDGVAVDFIHADLTPGKSDGSLVDATTAQPLLQNQATCCYGSQEKGSFELSRNEVQTMLRSPNPHGQSNANVIKRSVNGKQLSQRRADAWVVDFGNDMSESDATLYEAPFEHVKRTVYPERIGRTDKSQTKRWWLHARPSPVYRNYLKTGATRVIVSSAVAKHRLFSWISSSELADHALIVITRADDTTFGILHSRFHELWSLRVGTSLEDRPRYTPTTCFETFPFPAGLTPADTAHQRTETLPGGAVIPADVYMPNQPVAPVSIAQAATNNVASTLSSVGRVSTRQIAHDALHVGLKPDLPADVYKPNQPVVPVPLVQAATNNVASTAIHEPVRPEIREPVSPGIREPVSPELVEGLLCRGGGSTSSPRTAVFNPTVVFHSTAVFNPTAVFNSTAVFHANLRGQAIAIAQAAKRLNDLRNNWLNPPEWTHTVPEVTPLGMAQSPYPERILPKPGISADDLSALQKRTLTHLYNTRPAWLNMAHQQLDQAVAAAYGWADYRADWPDEAILQRLLALNLARAACTSGHTADNTASHTASHTADNTASHASAHATENTATHTSGHAADNTARHSPGNMSGKSPSTPKQTTS